jgi:hypothetical protein
MVDGNSNKKNNSSIIFNKYRKPMMFLIIVIISILMETATAADPNPPHPHQGIISKFIDPAPALISKQSLPIKGLIMQPSG